jgi:hypothetical protein
MVIILQGAVVSVCLSVCQSRHVVLKFDRFLHVKKLEISIRIGVVQDVTQGCAARVIARSLPIDRD